MKCNACGAVLGTKSDASVFVLMERLRARAGGSYETGLYNGALLILCSITGEDYEPININSLRSKKDD